jgi:hypothetical protein
VTVVARTLTNTWSALGAGAAISSDRSTSGGP